MKPYKLHRSQELTEDHKKQRYDFCKWIIDEEIDPNKIIFKIRIRNINLGRLASRAPRSSFTIHIKQNIITFKVVYIF